MASAELRWWGVILHLDQNEACLLAKGRPEGELALNAIPPPYGQLVIGAIALHKAIIRNNIGAQGIDIHISWAGVAHWFGRIGAPQACI
ncbi:hypothetical protein [Herbidospora daliensis]|uniref:hypothetical protein n=1 Tax=Herbidospora daliensis TaxID=295585 RepID=UPI000AFCBDA2|nr:hypothetical protein [Herbidospora daliensis]